MAKERELKWAKEAQAEMEQETAEAEVEAAAQAEETQKTAEGTENTEKSESPEGTEAAEAAAECEEETPSEDEKVRAIQEKYQRLFAEFDNFRKRTDKEKTARYDMGAKDVIEKILPVLDSFELALKNVPEEEKASPFAEGMDKIHKQFLKTLEEAGVKPIEAVGKEFDPAFHNAVMHVEDENAGENIVVEEFQKGYLYKDHVVRYSMVKIAN